MARVDPFIVKLFKTPAGPGSQLVFATGKMGLLLTEGGESPVIRETLTTDQIINAFSEIVPTDKRGTYPADVVFGYSSPAGRVNVWVERKSGAIKITVMAAKEEAAPAPSSSGFGLPVQEPTFGGKRSPHAQESPGIRKPTSAPKEPMPALPDLVPAIPERRSPANPVRGTATSMPTSHVSGSAAAPVREELASDARQAMHQLLDMMIERGASDLHLSSGAPPILRIDGDVKPIAGHPPLEPRRLEALLWSIAPERNRTEFEKTMDTDFGYESAKARFRINVFSDRIGIGAVLRQIPHEILPAEKMGLSKAVLDLCFLSKGLVLVTGPTGSGKSTTLASLIDYINRNRDDHIITIEDPIEFVHQNKRCLVNQRQVGLNTASFKQALRAALREDPDIVLVGELRDLETIAIAIETAETGHVVFGTLHTNTAPSTIDRIIDQFPPDRQNQIRTMLSESLKGVVSQNLCKKIGGGRVAAREVLLCNSAIANLIREGKTFQIPSLMQTNRAQGMVTMNDALLELVRKKTVDAREAFLKAPQKTEFRGMLQRAGYTLDEEEAVA